jgi:hypothetical protein
VLGRRLADGRAREPARGDRSQRGRQVHVAPVGARRASWSRTPGSWSPSTPPSATVGYLAQEHDVRSRGRTVGRESLARRTGSARGRVAELAAAAGRPGGRGAPQAEAAVRGGRSSGSPPSGRATSTPGSMQVLDDLGRRGRAGRTQARGDPVRRAMRAKVALAGIELSAGSTSPCWTSRRTTLDFAGLAPARVQWVASRPGGGTVVVSHDRDFLDRTVCTGVLELDAPSCTRARSTAAGGPGTRRSGPPPGATPARPTTALRPAAGAPCTRGPSASASGRPPGSARRPGARGQRQGPARLPHQPHREAGLQGPPDRARPARRSRWWTNPGRGGTFASPSREAPRAGRRRGPAGPRRDRARLVPPGTDRPPRSTGVTGWR